MENNRLGDVLVEKGKINRHQVKDAILYKLDQRKVKNRTLLIGEAFIELGFMDPPELMIMMENNGIRLRVGEILVKNNNVTYQKIHEIIDRGIEGLLLEELVKRYIISPVIMTDTLSEQVNRSMTPDAFMILFGKFLEQPKHEPLPYSKSPPPAERNWMTDPEMYIPDSVRMNDM